MLYSDKMTTNIRNTVIFEGKHLSEEKIKQKEINHDAVIKMFENLETKVHMAK